VAGHTISSLVTAQAGGSRRRGRGARIKAPRVWGVRRGVPHLAGVASVEGAVPLHRQFLDF